MSITIRLAKTGKRNAPTYKIVVLNTRDKRNGKFLDTLGNVNPLKSPLEINIDENKLKEWKSRGAIEAQVIKKLTNKSYKFEKYNPKGSQKIEGEVKQVVNPATK